MTTPSDIANAVTGAQKATVGIGSWPQWLTVLSILGVALGYWIKGIPGRTKADSDADAALRADEANLRAALVERITRLEEKVDKNEAECALRIETAIKANTTHWENEIARMRFDYENQIQGLMRQIAGLQVDTGKVIRMASGSDEPSTSMERVLSRVITDRTDTQP